MININFFRKEARNILPLLLVLVFLLGALAIAVEVYYSRILQEAELEESQIWLEAHAEDLELSREMRVVEQWISQAVDVQETLRREQFAMDLLSEEMTALIPEEDERVTSFQISKSSKSVALVLENTGTAEALQIVGDLEELPYVVEVQLLSVELQDEESQEFGFNLSIDLDFEGLPEEDAE